MLAGGYTPDNIFAVHDLVHACIKQLRVFIHGTHPYAMVLSFLIIALYL